MKVFMNNEYLLESNSFKSFLFTAFTFVSWDRGNMDTKCKNKLTKKAVSNVQPTFKLQSLNISTADSLLLLLNQTKKRIRKTTYLQSIIVLTINERVF